MSKGVVLKCEGRIWSLSQMKKVCKEYIQKTIDTQNRKLLICGRNSTAKMNGGKTYHLKSHFRQQNALFKKMKISLIRFTTIMKCLVFGNLYWNPQKLIRLMILDRGILESRYICVYYFLKQFRAYKLIDVQFFYIFSASVYVYCMFIYIKLNY